jgi:DNA invertase Pin-like site-specific DNA recombinase
MQLKGQARKAHTNQRFQQLRAKTSRTVEIASGRDRGRTEAVRAASIRAAQYVRMSTDRQEYSIENQSVANHAYAARHGMEIVRTYADEGKSGVTFAKRNALKLLINDVQTGSADFVAILVYDISRWGRFQDADESGYYEHICKRAGIVIHYCAEQFENDGTAFAAIVKAIKRAMAGEYSRELSVKSFVGQARLVRLGFRAGAAPGYGLRRLLVDKAGNPKCILHAGERKNLQDDRVVLILGPSKELRVVRWIFSKFVKDRKSEGQIAKILNGRGIDSGLPRPWTPARVRWLLRNENYIGNILWNRTSIKLGKKLVRNPPEMWLRSKTSFGPVIDAPLFEAAQAIFRERRIRLTKEVILEALRRLQRKYGFLDTWLVIDSPDVPSISTIHKHFGGLRQVYKLLGSKGPPDATYNLSDDELLTRLRRVLRTQGRLTEDIIKEANGVPHADTYRRRFGSLSQAYRLVGYRERSKSHQALLAKTLSLTDREILEALRRLLRKRGRLTQKIIDRSGETPTSPTYCRRFGSLTRAYELIGYRPIRAAGARRTSANSKKGDDARSDHEQMLEKEIVDGMTGFLWTLPEVADRHRDHGSIGGLRRGR